MRWAVLILASVVSAQAADRWIRLSTPQFELYTTAGEKKGKDTLRHFEKVREFFLKASPVRAREDFPVRIVEFATEDQFRPYRPNATSSAYFFENSAHDYIVLGNQASYPTAIHEYMHLIVRHSGLRIPLWLNEGWADVYSTLRPMGKETAVGDLLENRMQSLATDKWLSFDELTDTDTKSKNYHEGDRVGIFYAESWALAHMLYLAPDYQANFGKFIDALHHGSPTGEAIQIAWNRTPDQVYRDLQKYLDRKKIYGRIFEASSDDKQAEPVASPVSEFDTRLMLVDLLLGTGKTAQAKQAYAQLEQEQPDNPQLAQSIGLLAEETGDRATARRYLEKAFAEGDADPKMCLELAMMEGFAHEPPEKIVPILERAVKAKPDFTEAKVRLGLAEVDARDFPAAVSTLMAIPKVTPEQAPGVFCGLGYAYLETGDPAQARSNAETCRKWAKAGPDARRADELVKLAEARARPSAGVHPGEAIRRVAGIARSMECSPEGNRLQIVAGSQVMTFDLPPLDAVEATRRPLDFTLACGALRPFRMTVEYAPPRSAVETSAGIVRRIVF